MAIVQRKLRIFTTSKLKRKLMTKLTTILHFLTQKQWTITECPTLSTHHLNLNTPHYQAPSIDQPRHSIKHHWENIKLLTCTLHIEITVLYCVHLVRRLNRCFCIKFIWTQVTLMITSLINMPTIFCFSYWLRAPVTRNSCIILSTILLCLNNVRMVGDP